MTNLSINLKTISVNLGPGFDAALYDWFCKSKWAFLKAVLVFWPDTTAHIRNIILPGSKNI